MFRRIWCAAFGILATLILAAPTTQGGTEDKVFTVIVTPKFLRDLTTPRPAIKEFFTYYTTHLPFRTYRVVFAVGNSDHILGYPGRDGWNTPVPWARYTEDSLQPRRPGQQLPRVAISQQTLTYRQIAGIVRVFRDEARRAGVRLTILDQLDKNGEFTEIPFKLTTHPEIFSKVWRTAGLLIAAPLAADPGPYAAYPSGIPGRTHSGTFIAKQTAAYVRDLGFDGIFLSNQVGTRGHWDPRRAPGYSPKEAREITHFFRLLREHVGTKEIVWWDSTNPVAVEHDRWSVDQAAYRFMDTIAAAGFCVIRSNSEHYRASLESKLALGGHPRVTATLDYVEPYYTYNSWRQFPACSSTLKEIAAARWDALEGVFTFGHDERGNFIPERLLDRFATLLANWDSPRAVVTATSREPR
jgi:hypothetical protein